MNIPFAIARAISVQERQAAYLREHLTLSDEIGMALRAARRWLRHSQRAYAALGRWSAAHQGRLETRAADLPLRSVSRALEHADFGLVIVDSSDGSSPRLGGSVEAVASWVRARMAESGVSTRWVAEQCDVSQTMVSRLRDARRAGSVRLSTVQKVIRVLGGEIAVGLSVDGRLAAIDPQSWPTAAVLPRSRGRRRRLAAHGWLRRQGPTWFRWSVRPHLGLPPTWTAEAPPEPHRGWWEPGGNAIAPSWLSARAVAA